MLRGNTIKHGYYIPEETIYNKCNISQKKIYVVTEIQYTILILWGYRTRDQAWHIAEKSEGKNEEQERWDVINWRRECAIMKKQNSLSKMETWN